MMRSPLGSASIAARSSSLSSKSKTSKFSTRRSWLEAFGIVHDLRLVEQPAQRDLAGGLAVRLADLAQRLVLRDLAAGERRVGGDHEVLLRRELDERVLAQEGVELDLVGEDRRELSASRSIAAGKFETPRCLISPSSRSPTSAPSVSSSGKSGFGQCRSSRSRPSTCRFCSESSAARRRSSGAYSSRQIFVVRKNSLRGTPAAASPRPTSLLVAVGARGVDVPVADRERVLDRLLALRPLDLPGAEAQLGDGRALDLEGAHGCVDRGHPGPVPIPARLLAFPAFPGRLAQLGERRLDKAEVTGSSPVSPTSKTALRRGFRRSRGALGLNPGLNLVGTTPVGLVGPADGVTGLARRCVRVRGNASRCYERGDGRMGPWMGSARRVRDDPARRNHLPARPSNDRGSPSQQVKKCGPGPARC